MKLPAGKPASSPGRADKYPPPLMRFLRSDVGSRSRGRSSRARPLFMRRKRTTAIEAHPEPSSPKVTCMGQVRVRRSSSGSSKSKPGLKTPTHCNAAGGNRLCCWVGSLCRRRRPGQLRPDWRRWASLFRCGSSRVRTHSSRNRSNGSNEVGRPRDGDRGEEEEEEEDQEFSKSGSLCQVDGSDSSTGPPTNALLLTRCRSAPQRSSYLASRLWESPLETEEKTGEQENRGNTAEEEEEEEQKSAETRIDREGEGELEICKEGFAEKAVEGEKQREGEADEVKRPVMLTRCKSEPARSSGDPLTSTFWRERRVVSTLSCTHSVEDK